MHGEKCRVGFGGQDLVALFNASRKRRLAEPSQSWVSETDDIVSPSGGTKFRADRTLRNFDDRASV
jgi:hypothetical protein